VEAASHRDNRTPGKIDPHCLLKFTVWADPSDVIALKATNRARRHFWARLPQWVLVV